MIHRLNTEFKYTHHLTFVCVVCALLSQCMSWLFQWFKKLNPDVAHAFSLLDSSSVAEVAVLK